MRNEARKNSKNSARLSRNEYGVGRGDYPSNKFFLEPNSIDSVRIAFRRAISKSQSAYTIEQWRITYAQTIIPISATLSGATLMLAWYMAFLQSMVAVVK